MDGLVIGTLSPGAILGLVVAAGLYVVAASWLKGSAERALSSRARRRQRLEVSEPATQGEGEAAEETPEATVYETPEGADQGTVGTHFRAYPELVWNRVPGGAGAVPDTVTEQLIQLVDKLDGLDDHVRNVIRALAVAANMSRGDERRARRFDVALSTISLVLGIAAAHYVH